MTRRNTQEDQIIEQLGQFLVEELGVPYADIEHVVDAHLDAALTSADVICFLWDEIQRNDPDPEPDVAAYLVAPALPSLAETIIKAAK